MSADGSGGFLLSLLTESFAVRALIGSLAAAVLAALAVRMSWVRSSRARRIVLLAPVLTAAIAGLASLRDAEAYLPQLWFATSASGPTGQLLEFLGELRAISTERGFDLLAVAYGLVVVVLLARRASGLLAVRELLSRASEPVRHPQLVAMLDQLASQMGLRTPRLLMLPACPGGAFTTGVRRPLIVVDSLLVSELDELEIQGLLAHELAHVARRDTLLGMVVGAFRDCTFFLPPLHLAARWLRREQEESADELASLHTGRPAALASSILKVWDCSRGRHVPASACAAIGWRGTLLPAPAGGPTPPPVSAAARTLAARVERLISMAPAVTSRRRRLETILAVMVLATATGASIAVPAWMSSNLEIDSVSFGYLAATATPVESPAFSTFRALTPEASSIESARPASPALAPPTTGENTSTCPCTETRAQLEREVGATGTLARARMLWAAEGADAWEISERADVRARPLWTLTDSGPQVGFFLVARSAS